MNLENGSRVNVRRTAQQIEELVVEFERSGRTIGDFAHQQGVAVSTVNRWLSKQRRRKVARLVEVNRVPNLGSSSRAATLRLSRGLVLELERGFQAEPVARLVQLLEGR